MIGGGDGASVTEVATSLLARCLGAMKNWEIMEVWMKNKKKKEIHSLKKIRNVLFLREGDSLFQPTGLFLDMKLSTFASSKGAQAVI